MGPCFIEWVSLSFISSVLQGSRSRDKLLRVDSPLSPEEVLRRLRQAAGWEWESRRSVETETQDRRWRRREEVPVCKQCKHCSCSPQWNEVGLIWLLGSLRNLIITTETDRMEVAPSSARTSVGLDVTVFGAESGMTGVCYQNLKKLIK